MNMLGSLVMRLGSIVVLACAVACSGEATDHVLQAPTKERIPVAAAGAGGEPSEAGAPSTGGTVATPSAGQGGEPTTNDAGTGGELGQIGGQFAAGGEPAISAGAGGKPVAQGGMAGQIGMGGTTSGASTGGAPMAGTGGSEVGGAPSSGAGGEAPVDPFGCAQPDGASTWVFYTVQPGECLTAGAAGWKNTPANWYVWAEASPANEVCDAALRGWVTVRPGVNGEPITVAIAVDNNWPSADFGAAVRKNLEGNVQAGLPNCSNLPIGVGL
jgi:hypothetical protein